MIPWVHRRFWIAGFTLLELTVAVALSGLLLTAVVVLAGRGITAWQRADGMLQQMFRVEKGLNQMGEDLRNAEALAERPFQGGRDRLSFALSEGSGRLSEVTYRLEQGRGGQSLIREKRNLPIQEGEPVEAKAVLDGVASFSIGYGALQESGGRRGLRWRGKWDSSAGDLSVIPKLIRVDLQSRDSRGGLTSATRYLWVPQGVLRAESQE